LNLISFARVCPIAPMVDSRSWTTFERATKATAFLCYVTPTEEHSSTSETGTSLQRTLLIAPQGQRDLNVLTDQTHWEVFRYAT